MKPPEPTEISLLIKAAFDAYDSNRERTKQARKGHTGPSDLGFCRQRTALVTREVQPTESKSMWAAMVGTAIHDFAKAALSSMFPDWICDFQRVTATFPRTGAEVSGTPDIIVPAFNLILDIKSVDGFEKILRFGVSKNHRFQRHTYAMGAVAAGLLDPTAQVYVGNVYVDRSGNEGMPIVLIEEFDEALTEEIDSWIEDVIYAVRHNEDAERDIAAPVCEKICEFYTACRGSLPMSESEPITHEDHVQAIQMYVEGRDMAKKGEAMKKEAASVLSGINGSDGRFQVRWTYVAPTDVPGFSKRGYSKIDIREIR